MKQITYKEIFVFPKKFARFNEFKRYSTYSKDKNFRQTMYCEYLNRLQKRILYIFIHKLILKINVVRGKQNDKNFIQNNHRIFITLQDT